MIDELSSELTRPNLLYFYFSLLYAAVGRTVGERARGFAHIQVFHNYQPGSVGRRIQHGSLAGPMVARIDCNVY